jgi:hypothetical protein
MGGREKAFTSPAGDPVLVNAQSLADHLEPDRAPFTPMLPTLIMDLYEIWLSFEQHKGTGRVVLRQRFIKFIKTSKARGYVLVAQAVNGAMGAWTVVPVSDLAYLQRQRRGRLIWARAEK